MEAIRGLKTLNEIGQQYGVHPVVDGHWKKELLDAEIDPHTKKRTLPNCVQSEAVRNGYQSGYTTSAAFCALFSREDRERRGGQSASSLAAFQHPPMHDKRT